MVSKQLFYVFLSLFQEISLKDRISLLGLRYRTCNFLSLFQEISLKEDLSNRNLSKLRFDACLSISFSRDFFERYQQNTQGHPRLVQKAFLSLFQEISLKVGEYFENPSADHKYAFLSLFQEISLKVEFEREIKWNYGGNPFYLFFKRFL